MRNVLRQVLLCTVRQALLAVLHSVAPQQVRVRRPATVQVPLLSPHVQAQREHEVSHRLGASGADAGVSARQRGCFVRDSDGYGED